MSGIPSSFHPPCVATCFVLFLFLSSHRHAARARSGQEKVPSAPRFLVRKAQPSSNRGQSMPWRARLQQVKALLRSSPTRSVRRHKYTNKPGGWVSLSSLRALTRLLASPVSSRRLPLKAFHQQATQGTRTHATVIERNISSGGRAGCRLSNGRYEASARVRDATANQNQIPRGPSAPSCFFFCLFVWLIISALPRAEGRLLRNSALLLSSRSSAEIRLTPPLFIFCARDPNLPERQLGIVRCGFCV